MVGFLFGDNNWWSAALVVSTLLASPASVAGLAATNPKTPSGAPPPPPETTTNMNEARFDQMVSALSPKAIECIDNPRSRVLFKGVEAGGRNEDVRTAFRIVYRDLAPIRVAGDLIFGQLVAVADQATEKGETIDDNDNDSNNESQREGLAISRRLFDLLDGDNSGGLDCDELLASPSLLELVRVSGNDSDTTDTDAMVVDRFMALADENGDGVVSFVEFANAAAKQPRLRLVDDALAAAFASSAANDNNNNNNNNTKKGNKKRLFGRKPPDERFDEMLKQCLEWEERLGCAPGGGIDGLGKSNNNDNECTIDAKPEQQEQHQASNNNDNDDINDEEGRLLQVLKGALVGARCDPLVEALKMCYLDYSPLRLGGDVIFKLLGRVVRTQLPPPN